MCVGNALVDRHDLVHGQNIARGFAGEFISTVAGANRYCQGIDTGALDKVFGLHRVGEQHVVGEFAHSANAVFFTGLAGFQ